VRLVQTMGKSKKKPPEEVTETKEDEDYDGDYRRNQRHHRK